MARYLLDGTKIKANASNKRVAHKDNLEKAMQKVEKDIVDMLEEAEALDAQDDAQFGSSNSGEELPEKIKKAKERKRRDSINT